MRTTADLWQIADADLERYRVDLGWLFAMRNQAVHGEVWKDEAWEHPSGLSVSKAQERIGLESAERAFDVCQGFISLCLISPCRDDELESWAALRRERCAQFLRTIDP